MATERDRVLAAVDEPRLLDLVTALVRADSQNPPGREAAAAAVLADYLRSVGLDVTLDEVQPGRPNLYALLPGESDEPVVFNGHLDTVTFGDPAAWTTDPLGAEFRDGRLYGRGACDMKAGLAAMAAGLAAAAAVAATTGARLPHPVLFTAVIDEEVWFAGTTALIASGRLGGCRRAYVAEPTGLTAATALQGAAEFTATVRGRAAHSGMAELGVNAIAGMGRVVAALTDYHDALQGRGSLNLGRIEGGVGVTLVPDECRLAFDRQVFPGEDLDAVVAGLRELFAHVVATHGLDGDLVLDQSFPWWRADPGSTAVADLVAAHTAATGAPPRESVFRAYCEVELLARAGLDGVVYGPGDLRQAHRPDEFVDWPEVVTAARTYALLAAGVGTRYVSA